MQTATPRQRMEYCRAFQDVTGNGVVFDRNLVGHRGARFTLLYECPLEAA